MTAAVRTATVQVPMEARLIVEIGLNGDHGRRPATGEDMALFGLVDRQHAYRELCARLRESLGNSERRRVRDDLTETVLNPVRYLLELTLLHPKLDHADALPKLRRLVEVLNGVAELLKQVDRMEAEAGHADVPSEALVSASLVRRWLEPAHDDAGLE